MAERLLYYRDHVFKSLQTKCGIAFLHKNTHAHTHAHTHMHLINICEYMRQDPYLQRLTAVNKFKY